MIPVVQKIYNYFERQAFGVCTWWGEKLRIETSQIRLFFIYSSFLTLGSPILVYMAMAFILRLRNKWKRERLSVWDL